jgi:TM2 domain-containing membrane protein YozV
MKETLNKTKVKVEANSSIQKVGETQVVDVPNNNLAVTVNNNNNNNNLLISTNEEENKYFTIQNIVCYSNTCKYPYAVCLTSTVCKCIQGYANFIKDGAGNGLYCQYSQKKQSVAFILELFFPLGVGHFYSGRVLLGIIKLILLIAPCFLCCSSFFCNPEKDEKGIFGFLIMGISVLYVLWQFIDLIILLCNGYNDGNGVPMKGW